MENILDIRPKQLLEHFVELLEQNGIENPQAIAEHGAETINGLHLNGDDRDATYGLRALQIRWYESLKNGQPDYTVYDDDYYLADLWACWIVYSRYYLRLLRNPRGLFTHSMVDELGDIDRIVDLGCGFGYSTIAMKQIWPNAHVIGTNLRDTLQFRVASKLGQEYGFDMIDEGDTIPRPVDLIFASEYFEHIFEPITHLRQIIRQAQPRHILVANSFGPEAIGHFNQYLVDGEILSARQTSKKFSKELIDSGYELVKTRFWNNRPLYFRKVGA